MPRSPKRPILTHLDADGRARMVDVSGKRESARSATAAATVVLGPRAYRALDASENAKGDALSVARLAGIQAAKRTADLVPLCHPLVFDAVEVTLARVPEEKAVRVEATVRGTAKTGYEMESLVAAAAAALALYDMCKAADKGIEIRDVRLLAKSGGKSGPWVLHGGSSTAPPATPQGEASRGIPRTPRRSPR